MSLGLPAALLSAVLTTAGGAATIEDLDAALDDGNYRTALALTAQIREAPGTSDEVAAAARLAALVAAQRLGAIDAIDAALLAIAEKGPDLGTYAVDARVTVLASRRDCVAARDLSQTLDGRSVYASQSWSRVAHCFAKTGALDDALAAAARFAEQADSRSRQASAQLLLAELLIDAERFAEAGDKLRDLLNTHARSSQAEEAKHLLHSLRRRGVRATPASPEELLEQADRERAQQNIGGAKTIYKTIQEQTRPMKPTHQAAALGLVEIDMVNRAYGRALKSVDTILARATDEAVVSRALYLRGDILSRRGRVSDALAAYNELRERFPSEPFAIEGTLAALRLAYGSRMFDKAWDLAQWLLAHADPARSQGPIVADDGVHRSGQSLGTARDHALWALAWLSRRASHPDEEMESYLSQLSAEGPFGIDALYWRMRLALRRGDRDGAEVFGEMIGEVQPISYAALATRDLLGEGVACRVVITTGPAGMGPRDAQVDRPPPEPADLRGPVALFEHGLVRAARQALRAIPATSLSWEDRVAAAWLYRSCGELHLGAVLARRAAATAEPHLLDPALLELAFPRPFAAEVARAAQKHQVPAELIYAVMREESAFDPKARSPRAARGLMQMIPPTARTMAGEAQLRRFSLRKLYEPSVAIELGAVYLKTLLDLFDGNVVATIAAYHAGENAVGRWLRSRGQLPLDEFIEDIPFSSTRGYVKKVLASYGVYRLIGAPPSTKVFDVELTRAAGAAAEVAAN